MTSSRMSKTRIGTLAVAVGVVFLASCARLELTLAPAAISIDEGETEGVTATVTRKGLAQEGVTVEFESGDEAVASVAPASATTNAAGVAQATVSGESDGTTTVTATADGESVSTAVTVSAEPPTGPVVLTLSPAAIAIDVGETQAVTATVARNGTPQAGVTVDFASGDESVASVSPASATTNAAGQAHVTVTGGSAGNTAVTATAEGETLSAVVTVTEPVGRQIEIVGTSGDITNWHVTIDGVAQALDNPKNVTVGPGDKVTWRVEGGFHGVGFFGQVNAEAILEFDPAVGQPRSASPGGLDAGWFGTEGISSGILARATVRAGVASTELDFTCVVHGSSDIAVNNMRGKLVIP